MGKYTYITYTYIYTQIFIFSRDRTASYFFNFFNKPYLNDVICNNANQFILTC